MNASHPNYSRTTVSPPFITHISTFIFVYHIEIKDIFLSPQADTFFTRTHCETMEWEDISDHSPGKQDALSTGVYTAGFAPE